MQDAISILDVESRNALIDIIDPITDEPMGLQIELLAPSDPTLVRIEKKYKSDIRDASRRSKSADALHNAFEIDYPAAAIAGWNWDNATLGGTTKLSPIEFTPENVRAVLKVKKLGFIRQQVNEKLNDEGSFLKV